MDVSLHLEAALEGALSLANGFGPGFGFGRPIKVASPGEARDLVHGALQLATSAPPYLTEAQIQLLGDLGTQLWSALCARAKGEAAGAAGTINDLLLGQDVRPYLSEHPHGPWHLHFSSAGASIADRWAGDFTVAAAMLLGSSDAANLRLCSAIRCERLFIDTTRNHSRRFCSASCQTRAKVALHRQRKHHANPPGTSRASTPAVGEWHTNQARGALLFDD